MKERLERRKMKDRREWTKEKCLKKEEKMLE